MLAQTAEPAALTDAEHKSNFFRQSGWMMISAVGGGVLMYLVHVYSKWIPESEYGVMATLFQVLAWITMPAIGLQTTFAQQTSAAVTELQKRQVYGTMRAVMRGTFVIWLGMVAITIIWRSQIVAELKINDPASLWLTLVTGLIMIWGPIWLGLLQGRQNFLWLGWSAVFSAVGRLGIAGIFVFYVTKTAGGIMTGVLVGCVAMLAVGLWHGRDVWKEPFEPFQSREWLRRVVPLSFGCATGQFLLSADAIMVQSHMSNTGPYMFGGTLARAIVWFTAPLVAVMFPKIVHSAARNQKSNIMVLTLLVTAALCSMAAIGLTIVAPFLIKHCSNPGFASILPLLPLFAWSMTPLAVGNVLVNNLMAHSRFKCVPALVAVAVGYWVALSYFHDSFKMVIEVLGIFNLLFLAVCAVFTWGIRHEPVLEPIEPFLPGEKL